MQANQLISLASSFLDKKYNVPLAVHPSFRSMLRAVGSGHGGEVGMAWVYHVFNVVCMANGETNLLAPTPFVGVQWLHVFAGSFKICSPHYFTKKKVVTIDFNEELEPSESFILPGDIFLVANSYGQWHCGIVKDVKRSGVFTIETAAQAIVSKRREFSSIRRIIRIC